MLRKLNKELVLHWPDAILFDTDNTLYDYEPANNAALMAVETKVKNLLGVSSEIFRATYSQAKREVKKQLGETASSHSRLLYFQRMLELMGFKAQLLAALDLEQTFWRTFLANAPLFPGVIDLLEDLRYNKIGIAIVTDLTSHIQLRKLTYFHLEETFDAVVTSEEVGADKPDPRNFELVLNKLGLTRDHCIWMVGDNPMTDVVGGRQIGAVTFQKVHSGVSVGTGQYTPDYVFNDFRSLHKLVKRCLVSF
jgi:HAD superfamily hydrolase (TIGR01549 family)